MVITRQINFMREQNLGFNRKNILTVKLLPEDINSWALAGVLFVTNLVIGLGALEIFRRAARRQRQEVEGARIQDDDPATMEPVEAHPAPVAAH